MSLIYIQSTISIPGQNSINFEKSYYYSIYILRDVSKLNLNDRYRCVINAFSSLWMEVGLLAVTLSAQIAALSTSTQASVAGIYKSLWETRLSSVVAAAASAVPVGYFRAETDALYWLFPLYLCVIVPALKYL